MQLPRRLRVVRVYDHLDMGGIQRRLVDLLPRLDRELFDVQFVCTRRRGRLAPNLERQGIPVHECYISSNMPVSLAGRRLARTLRELKADIVQGHHDQIAQVATRAGRLAETPIIIANFHNVDLFGAWGELRRERRQSPMRDANIHVSERARQDYMEKVRPKAHRGVVIYNGVDPSLYAEGPDPERRREILSALGIDGRGPVLLNVARLSRDKAQEDLFDAFVEVRKTHPRAVILIAGEGRVQHTVEAAIASRGLEDDVKLLGVYTNIGDLYHIADINVLSSLREGFSNVVLEAMAAGVPQVLTDVGGNLEAIGDGEAGLIVPPRDPGAMAQAVLRVLDDSALAATMRVAARERVQRFTVTEQVRQTEGLYLDLAREKGLLSD